MKLSIKDDIIYLDEGKMEIFTPQDYIGTISHINGDILKTFGAAVYKFYKDPKDKKPTKVGTLMLPSFLNFYPTYIDQNVNDTIWDGIYTDLNENTYCKLSFEKGSRVVQRFSIQHLDNVVTFLDLLMARKVDNNIPYPLLSKIFTKNSTDNGVDLGVPIQIIDLIIYKVCRDKKDVSRPFGQIIGKNPKVSPIAYQFANMRDICGADSVFAALTFEDMNTMLDSSLNMTMNGDSQNLSPTEQIIKM
jgi:hypothetical protein